MADLQIITTGDGSHSLLHTSLDETYHSRHGALQESLYVFIEKGLTYYLDGHGRAPLSILEIGFGTGLNAWLTWLEAQKQNARIRYTSLEAFPLQEEIWRKLNYAQSDKDVRLFHLLHAAAWDQWLDLDSHFALNKRNITLQDVSFDGEHFDVIFFDAFAPSKQPEMWTLPVLEKTVAALQRGGVFVTYCAKGQLKRDLKSLGMSVETLPGPPGKKEMVRATKS